MSVAALQVTVCYKHYCILSNNVSGTPVLGILYNSHVSTECHHYFSVKTSYISSVRINKPNACFIKQTLVKGFLMHW